MSARTLFMTGILLMSVASFSATAQEKLLIIAPDDFIDELEPLQRFKEATARPTTLLSLTEVDNGFTGVDQPESIKKCIHAYKKTHNIQFAMLVGDCDKFPVRYLCRDVPVAKGYQPSDLYYADLCKPNGSFDNWDGNGNGLYAQFLGSSNTNNVDQVDWHPDIAVGRVPASDDVEVRTYVNKVIRYELGSANSQWFKRALFATGKWGADIQTKDYIATNYLSGFNIIKHYHTTVWSLYPIDTTNQSTIDASMDARAAPMTNHLNQGVGFLNYYGHGDLVSFVWVYCARHLDDLTNTDKLPVVFSAGCQNGEFAPNPPWQDYYDTNNAYHAAHAPAPDESVPTPKPIQPGEGTAHDCDREARPEDWLVYRDAGAIAFIGSAGKGNPSIPDKLDTKLFQSYSVGHRAFGKMWAYMIQEYLDAYGYFDAQGNVIKTPHPILGEWERNTVWNGLVRYNAFGDPSLLVGGAFTTSVSGAVADAWLPYFGSYARYRITGNVMVPAGKALTADQGASILFESGRKITAADPGANLGFHANGKPNAPVYLLTAGPQPSSQNAVRGVRIRGQMRLRNGGTVKLY